MQKLMSNEFGEITKKAQSTDVDVLDINHNTFHAVLSLYGGQVLTWTPQNQPDVFWQSNSSTYQQGKAIRGGIPLCWPWFGPKKGGVNHGFARTKSWQFERATFTSENVEIVLSLAGVNESEVWPYAYQLTQTLILSEGSLIQKIRVDNTDTVTWHFGSALHSYFRLKDVRNAEVTVLNETVFDDKISGEVNCSPSDISTLLGPIDRIYHSNKSLHLIDHSWQRQIQIDSINNKQSVLWNPGTAIANSMADVHDSGEFEFVCIEPANTIEIELAAKESFTFGQEIIISKIS